MDKYVISAQKSHGSFIDNTLKSLDIIADHMNNAILRGCEHVNKEKNEQEMFRYPDLDKIPTVINTNENNNTKI